MPFLQFSSSFVLTQKMLLLSLEALLAPSALVSVSTACPFLINAI